MTKPIPLATALAAAKADVVGPDCGVKLLADTLTRSERDALRVAFADSTIKHAALAGALKAAGKRPITATTISRHRRGECACSLRGFTL